MPWRFMIRSLCLVLLPFLFILPVQGQERPIRVGFAVPLTGVFGKDGAEAPAPLPLDDPSPAGAPMVVPACAAVPQASVPTCRDGAR